VCVAGGVLLLIGSRYVRRDITLVIEDVIERFAEGKRRQGGGDLPALQIHNLDFYYGTNQVLFDMNLEVAPGEMVALLGTNGAGKSTLLRAVSGLSHPHRGVVRIFGMNSTYLEPEQIIEEGVALLVGGKMTFPGLSVRDNLRVGGHTMRRDRARSAGALEEALHAFPALKDRLDQPAGTLSGGEQQMLALARVMMTRPRLLLIDELALGLAPLTVDLLMAMVRRINEEGTTVILVEQSINRAVWPSAASSSSGARSFSTVRRSSSSGVTISCGRSSSARPRWAWARRRGRCWRSPLRISSFSRE
jgi:ABC-type branched-subunit amino acid transport system ATPase component